MKLVILAAGRGKRMGQLTEHIPKPLLKVAGKTLLQHKLDILPKEITEIIVIVGYLGDMIRAEFGDMYKGIPIRYIEQKELLGTAHSLWQAKEFLPEKFLLLTADDLYCREDLERMVQHEWSILVKKEPHLVQGGKVLFGSQRELLGIVEGSNHGGIEGYIYTSATVLTPEIFQYDMVKLPGREEYGLPQTIISAVKKGKKVVVEEATFWEQATDPSDIARLDILLSPLS